MNPICPITRQNVKKASIFEAFCEIMNPGLAAPHELSGLLKMRAPAGLCWTVISEAVVRKSRHE